MDREDVFRFVEDNDVKFIRLQFTDISGIMKNIAINETNLENALDGVTFDGYSIEGFARMEESDMCLVPDLDTLNIIPWRPQQGKVARFICDVLLKDGTPFAGDPRHVLKNVVKETAQLGYTFNVEPECEFFLFHTDENGLPTTQTHDTASYFDLAPIDLGENARREMCFALENMGFFVESSHHEVAAGQHEIDFKYDEALKAADNIETFKMVVKIIAQKHGLHATFMPKPLRDEAGSGMHLNMSLLRDGQDAFADPAGPLGLSRDAYHFMGGIMRHIRGMTAILNPLVNSYKRLTPGNEAPAYIYWSRKTRSPLIRIPSILHGDTLLELLSPDPTCNPYLALAVLLAAGLEGIREEIEPPAEFCRNIADMTAPEIGDALLERLPESLGDALDEMEKDILIRKTLGEFVFSSYLTVKRKEWEEYSREVHDWERDRYLSLY